MRKVLVYAMGGGAGHLARAMVYAERCLPGEAAVTIFHDAAAPVLREPPARVHLRRIGADAGELHARVREALGDARGVDLVVDTFPAGLAHEIDDALLARAARTTLIRRFVKPLAYRDYASAAARFDDVVFPYPRGRSEWEPHDEDPASDRARFAGLLVRPIGIGEGPPAPLAVLGDPARLGAAMRRRLPRGTCFVSGPITFLPPARAYLGTAAGYHLAYELAALAVPFGLMPMDKRYDDQFRRADLLGRAVLDAAALDGLLAEAA